MCYLVKYSLKIQCTEFYVKLFHYYYISNVFSLFLAFFNRHFLEHFQVHSQSEPELSSISLLSPTPFPLLCLPSEWNICNNHWSYIDTIVTQIPWFTLGFTLRAAHSMGLNRCIIECMHHMQWFHCPKSPLCSIHPSLPSPNPWQPVISLFTLPFPVCHGWNPTTCSLFRWVFITY